MRVPSKEARAAKAVLAAGGTTLVGRLCPLAPEGAWRR